MAYDTARGRTVLFGGFGLSSAPLADTWEWDGVTWVQLFPATSPPARMGHAMAERSRTGRVVLYAGNTDGFGRSPLSDTWEWDGANWTQLTPPVAPGFRSYHTMVFDAARGRDVVFGGQISVGSGGPTLLADTWELFDRFGVLGRGHPGGGLPLTWNAPRIGTTFCVSFSNPPPGGVGYGLLLLASGGSVVPPMTLQPPGVCAAANLFLLPQAILTATGDPALFCLPIPANPALVGQPVVLQGASLEVGVCFRMTDAIGGEIQ
jgi:hypothetical protein